MRLTSQQPQSAPRAEAPGAPIGEHLVQFYETDGFLLDALRRYIQTGLEAGEACAVIATRRHRRQLEDHLRLAGLDPLALRRQGLYLSLDADKTLAEFMADRAPDPERFRRAAGRIIQRAAGGGRPVRVFGEMVAQLWLEGNETAAIRLEALWNDLQESGGAAFTLLCAYPTRLFVGEERQDALQDGLMAVCQQHDHIMPDELTATLSEPTERLRAFARLQQETHALQVEIAQRQLAEERLRVSEQRYRRLFEEALDGVLMLDPYTGRICDANPAAMRLLERSAEQLLGQEPWQMGLFADNAAFAEFIGALRRQPVVRDEALRLRTATGAERLVEFAGCLIALEDGDELVQCTIRDVTERQHLANELAERARALEAVQAITDIALAQPSLDGLLRALLERTGAILGVDNVAILLPDAAGRELTIHLAHGPEEEVAGSVHVPIGQGVAGTIAATRQPLVINDLRNATVANPFLRERLRSLMGVPLLAEDRLIGVIHASTIAPRHFTARETQLLQLVAGRIALAIERAQLLQAAQHARHEADERARQLHATIEAIADGVVVFDSTGRLLQMNVAAQQLLGIGETPQYDAAWTKISRRQVRDSLGREMPPSEWPVSRVLRGEVITGEQAADLIVRAADGHDIELSVSGAPMLDAENNVVGAVCVFRDVTAQRRLERRTHAALAALLAMASALVDLPPNIHPDAPFSSSPEGEADLSQSDAEADDTPTGKPPSASPVAHRLAQLVRDVFDCQRVGIAAIDPETCLQIPVAVVGLEPDAEREWWKSQLEHPQRYGDDGADPALLARFEAGEALVIDMTQPPYDSLPNPYGITTTLVAPMRVGSQLIGLFALDFGGVPHSFSEQERALAEAVAQLLALVIERDRILGEREEARASALAAQETARRMHTFLGIAGHELRTPVTAIKAGVQISEHALRTLLESTPPGMPTRPLQRAQTLLARADEQSNRLNRLIEDILDVIRTQSGRLELHAEPSDLAAVARSVVESQRLAWPGREITLTAPRRLPPIVMDADRIEQVISNYLTNALKYSEAHCPVAVEVSIRDQHARVAVRDHGPGLLPEMQTHLWEPFHQVEGIAQQSGSGVGLGLGLHICRTLVERHGGQVGVESALGEGSLFWFELPLTPSVLDGP